jgi:hypothetical protein
MSFFFTNFARKYEIMRKVVFLFVCCALVMGAFAQDANTGATVMTGNGSQQPEVSGQQSASGVDLSYTLVIVNKTASNYRVTVDNHLLGKVPPKKKQSFKAQTDWEGKLVAIQLDGYDIIPSKINWTVPKQTPGTTVTFTIK